MGQETELDTIGILRMQKRERLASLVSTDVIILWISKHGTRQMNARSLAQLAPLFANVKMMMWFFYVLQQFALLEEREEENDCEKKKTLSLTHCMQAERCCEYWVSYCTKQFVHVMETNYFRQPNTISLWLLKIVLIYCETQQFFPNASTIIWTIIVMWRERERERAKGACNVST